MKIITIEDCRNLKNKFERYCETAEQWEFVPLTILQMKLDKTLETIEKDGMVKHQKEARAMFQTILLVIGENADDYKEIANTCTARKRGEQNEVYWDRKQPY